MKKLPWILVILLVIACVVTWFRPHEPLPAEVRRDTVTIVDTVRDTILAPYQVEVIRFDTLWFPLLVDDGEVDSVPFSIPIESKEYRTEQYRAIISGYRPSLDFMETYNITQNITTTPKKKRLGLGLQVGYGYPSGIYAGVGVSYNLFQW